MTPEQIFKAFAMIRATLPGLRKVAVDPATYGACMFAMRSVPMVIDLLGHQDRPLTVYDIEVYKAPTDGSSGFGGARGEGQLPDRTDVCLYCDCDRCKELRRKLEESDK
jgi:hypothetical protein